MPTSAAFVCRRFCDVPMHPVPIPPPPLTLGVAAPTTSQMFLTAATTSTLSLTTMYTTNQYAASKATPIGQDVGAQLGALAATPLPLPSRPLPPPLPPSSLRFWRKAWR
jgi:hypothetical protein